MVDTDDKVEVKTYSESVTSSCASSDDEGTCPMMFLFRNLISFLFSVKSLKKNSKPHILKTPN